MYKIYIDFITSLVVSCTSRYYSPEVEETLKLAGSNRSELTAVLSSFVDIDKKLREDSTVTTVEACSRVNRLLLRFRMDKDFPPMSYSQLMATTRSMCDGETALTVFVMRALGIPVTIDFTPHWANGSRRHDLNSVCDSAGKHISFMGTESNPYESHQGTVLLKSKTYRRTFARNRIIQANGHDIPPVFNENMIDVSSEHESPENTYLANKLKYQLYYRALDEVFTYAKEYGKNKGMDVRCYVPPHSLVNYSSWQIVSPEARLASLPCVDGYIAQVWTGTSREATFFNGLRKALATTGSIWDNTSKTCLVKFENDPDGVTVSINF